MFLRVSVDHGVSGEVEEVLVPVPMVEIWKELIGLDEGIAIGRHVILLKYWVCFQVVKE
jgi:hypothetical protein